MQRSYSIREANLFGISDPMGELGEAIELLDELESLELNDQHLRQLLDSKPKRR